MSSPSEQLTRADLVIELALASTMLGREAARAGGVQQPTTTWFALTELSEQPLRLGELARRIGLSQPAASALLRNLQSRGWVGTTEDALDGRAKLLVLTAQGATELEGWRLRAAERLAEGLEGLSPSDEAAMRQTLTIIARTRGSIEKA